MKCGLSCYAVIFIGFKNNDIVRLEVFYLESTGPNRIKILVGTFVSFGTNTTFKLRFLNYWRLLTHKWCIRKGFRNSKIDFYSARIRSFNRRNVIVVVGLRTTRIGMSAVVIRERHIGRSQRSSI